MKTVIEMAREAGKHQWPLESDFLERFAALVAADERAACAKVCDRMAARCNDMRGAALESAAESIRLRSNA